MRRTARGRRGSGVAEAAPLSLGAYAWWDPSVGVTLDGANRVQSHVDRISSIAVIQMTGTQRPGWLASDPNLGNRPGAQYSRAGAEHLRSAANALSASFENEYEIWIDAYLTTAGAGTFNVPFSVCDSPTGVGARIWTYASTTGTPVVLERSDAGTPGQVALTSGHLGDNHGWFRSQDDTTNLAGLDDVGGSGSVARPARPLTARTCSVGALGTGNTWDGSIGHVVLYDRSLSASETTVMATWMDGLI